MLAILAIFLVSVEGTHQQTCTAAAHLGRWWYNGCAQRCICEQVAGEFVWTCYRERKEFSCMSSADRQLYFNTYKAISTPGHPLYPQYTALIGRHSTYFGQIHTTQFFLPWHRWFQNEMETLLQYVNCKVTLPWWDSAKNAGSPWGVSPWGASADLMGTAGSPCVTNGGFANPGWPGGAHGCLSRSNSGTLPTSMQEGTVLGMAASNYGAFSDALQTQIHNVAHVRVGGTMMQAYSPEAPEFFIHHGHIDKLWDDWQKKGPSYLNAYSFSSNAVMPQAMGATPAQFNNLKTTGVLYTRASLTPLGAGHFVFPACTLIVISSVLTIDADVFHAAIIKASPSTLQQIPQLAAPTLTSDQEKMMIEQTRKGRGTAQAIQEETAKLAAGRKAADARNQALKAAGNLKTSFDKSADRALGFDVAKAVQILKVPPAKSDSSRTPLPQSPASSAGARSCVKGTTFCAALSKCIPVGQRCILSVP